MCFIAICWLCRPDKPTADPENFTRPLKLKVPLPRPDKLYKLAAGVLWAPTATATYSQPIWRPHLYTCQYLSLTDPRPGLLAALVCERGGRGKGTGEGEGKGTGEGEGEGDGEGDGERVTQEVARPSAPISALNNRMRRQFGRAAPAW